MVAVTIHTDPPGASIKVDGVDRGLSSVQIDLPAGTYRVEAELADYQPAAAQLELKAGAPQAINLTLQPVLPLVKVAATPG